jgi:hypothetical protein
VLLTFTRVRIQQKFAPAYEAMNTAPIARLQQQNPKVYLSKPFSLNEPLLIVDQVGRSPKPEPSSSTAKAILSRRLISSPVE